jgi:hypothetical protein
MICDCIENKNELIRMMDPIVLNYGKGHMRGFIADPDYVFDIVGSYMIDEFMCPIVSHAYVSVHQ